LRTDTIFENKLTDFDANWHKWSTKNGHETIVAIKYQVISVTLLWALHAVTKQQFVLPLFYYSAEYECYSVVEYE